MRSPAPDRVTEQRPVPLALQTLVPPETSQSLGGAARTDPELDAFGGPELATALDAAGCGYGLRVGLIVHMIDPMVDVIKEKMTALVSEAERWLGTREAGRNAGAAVEAFQRAVDGHAAGEPWCLAFVQFCVRRVDQRIPGLGSWLHPTEHCLTAWARTTRAARVQTLGMRPGDLMLWQGFDGKVPLSSGHAGIVARVLEPGVFECIEGNTVEDGGGAGDREGEGVFRRRRDIHGTSRLRFLGALRPWGSGAAIRRHLPGSRG